MIISEVWVAGKINKRLPTTNGDFQLCATPVPWYLIPTSDLCEYEACTGTEI